MEDVARWHFYTSYEKCMDWKSLAAYDRRGGGGALFDLEDIVDFYEEEAYEGVMLFVVVFATVVFLSAGGALKGLI